MLSRQLGGPETQVVLQGIPKLCVFGVPGAVGITLQGLFYLIFTTLLGGKYSYDLSLRTRKQVKKRP